MECFNKRNLICGAILGFGAFKLWKMYQEFLKKDKVKYKCLFFSPNQIGCTAMCKVNPAELKRTLTCNNCSFNILTSYIMTANKCLDICLYLVTSEKLCDVILSLFKLGVHVRIIVDKNISEEAFGAKALLFQKSYVPLKIIECNHMMHNKFAIIDNETVMTGSLNWTNAGFYGNYENLLIISHKGIAKEYSNKNSKLTESPDKVQDKNFSSKTVPRNKLTENTKPTPLPPHSAKSRISATSDKKIIPSPTRDESRSARSVKIDSSKEEKKIGGRSTISEKGFGPPQKKTNEGENVKAAAKSVPRIQYPGNTNKFDSAYYQKFLGLRKPKKSTDPEKTDVKNFASIPKLENKQNVNSKKCELPMKTNLGRMAKMKKSTVSTAAGRKTEDVQKVLPKSSGLGKSLDSAKLAKCQKGEVETPDGKAVLLSPTLPTPSSGSRRTSSKETRDKSLDVSRKSREVKRMKSEGDSVHFQNSPSPARRTANGPRGVTSEIKDLNLNNKLEEKPNFTVKANCEETGIKSTVKKEITNQKLGIVSKPVLKNDVLHVNMVTDTKLGAVVKEEETKAVPREEEEAKAVLKEEEEAKAVPREEEEAKYIQKEEEDTKVVPREEKEPFQVLPPTDIPVIRPTETFDSFDSLEKGNYDELLSLDHVIWSDLDKKIKETYGKEDIYGSGDDSGESLSDIISKLSLDEDIKRSESPEKEKSATGNSQQKRVPEPEPILLKQAIPVIVKPGKRNIEPEAGLDSQELRNDLTDSPAKTVSASEAEEPKIKDSLNKHHLDILHEEKFVQLTAECISKEVPPSPTGFFKTHKKLGFIGKVEDEECVSFDVGQVKLYQPFESQMLFYDIANCIATQAYLKMCGMNYELEVRKNAEHMSPSGKVPFLSSCLCIIPEFDGIISFMQCKRFACFRIEENDKSAFRAMISMIRNTLESAERYICWYDEGTLMNYTKPRIGGMFPFPLNHILYWLKGYEERRNLNDEGRREISFDVTLREINACFRVLSQRLGDNSFFFGNISTEIDALVYGHIYALLTAGKEGIFKDLHLIIKQFPNLITFAVNFDKKFLLNKFPPVDYLCKNDS